MQVPKYERQVGMASPPDVNIPNVATPEVMGAGIGKAMENAGKKLAYIAVKQQEEADRLNFQMIGAKADSYADNLFMDEKENTDYEGTVNRFSQSWKQYTADTIKTVPDRLKEKAQILLQSKQLAYEPKFKGLFLDKQHDYMRRTLDDTVAQLVKNRDIAGMENVIQSSTIIDEKSKGDIIRKNKRNIQLDQLEGVIRNDPYAKWYKKDYDTFNEADFERMEDFQKSEQQAIELDNKRKKKEADDNYYESLAGQIEDIAGPNGSKSLSDIFAVASKAQKASQRSTLRNYGKSLLNDIIKTPRTDDEQYKIDLKYEEINNKIHDKKITTMTQFHEETDGIPFDKTERNRLKTKLFNMEGKATGSFDGEQQAINEAKAMLNYKPSDKEAVKELGKFTSALSDYIGELEQAKGRKLTEKEKLDAGEDLMSMPYFVDLPGPWNVGSENELYKYDQEYIDKAIVALNKQYKPITSGNILAMIGEILKTEDTTFRARFYHKPR